MLLIDCASKGEQQSTLRKENNGEIRVLAVQSKSVIESCHFTKENFRKGTAYSLRKKKVPLYSLSLLNSHAPKSQIANTLQISEIRNTCGENTEAEAACTTGSNAFTEGEGSLDIKGKFFIT